MLVLLLMQTCNIIYIKKVIFLYFILIETNKNHLNLSNITSITYILRQKFKNSFFTFFSILA